MRLRPAPGLAVLGSKPQQLNIDQRPGLISRAFVCFEGAVAMIGPRMTVFRSCFAAKESRLGAPNDARVVLQPAIQLRQTCDVPQFGQNICRLRDRCGGAGRISIIVTINLLLTIPRPNRLTV
jgi:hypothetical protein